MLYLSDWMMNSHHTISEQMHHEHQALRKKLASYYEDMGVDDIIEYSKEHDDYYELRDYDDELHSMFIEPYDNETFWIELSSRLAQRDLIKKIGPEKYMALEGIDRVVQLEKIIEKYTLEFEQHGLEYIEVNCNKANRLENKEMNAKLTTE